MLTLSEQDILALIRSEETFEATLEGGSLVLKVDAYLPAICTAIHQGSRLRRELEPLCALSESQRLYEEDPGTDALISSLPITLLVEDSRYEYDLNRPLAQCVYHRAWGKQVWVKPLSQNQINKSQAKHRQFFRILDALVGQLQQKFKACILFDVHSYNYKRIDRATPTFNLGTEQIDMERWGRVVNHFEQGLEKITLPNLEVTTAQDDVFRGRGYLIAHINSRFENTQVLPVEVKKVFMDELTGELYPLVLDELKEGMKRAITDTAAYFARRHTRKTRARRHEMLSATLDPAILNVDRQLYTLAKDVVILRHINPTNMQQEMRRFMGRKGDYVPSFTYQQLRVDPYRFKEELYRLPTDDIRDADIQQLYRQTINSFADKIDMLVSIGSDQFFYNSLRYYGEPSEQDLANARFLLYAPPLEEEDPANVGAEQMVAYLQEMAGNWGLSCKVEPSKRLVAAAMVDNLRKTLLVRRDAKVTQTELRALAHHELGVHMVTTLNAVKQPLKIFTLGLPGSTMAHEGLAILGEYLSGNLTLSRLQGLALRVVAVDLMIRHGDFRRTFKALHEEYGLERENAFLLTTRVHRGGGFTKDYLYLRGFRDTLRLFKTQDVSNLFIGKTGFYHLPLINELVARATVSPPATLPQFLNQREPSSQVLNYLVDSIR